MRSLALFQVTAGSWRSGTMEAVSLLWKDQIPGLEGPNVAGNQICTGRENMVSSRYL